MLERQIILPLEINGNRGLVKIPECVDKNTMNIWKLPNGVITAELPLHIVHGQTVFIIHLGHDYSINNNMFSTSNPDVYNNRILIEWGNEIFEKCSCGKDLKDEFSFCIHCGKQTNRENKLKYSNSI